MKWNHLPSAGGIYDQHPKLMDRFAHIFSERAKEESKKDAKRSSEMSQRQKNPGGSRPAGRRHR